MAKHRNFKSEGISENTTWVSLHGVAQPLAQVSDDHLANIVRHVEKYPMYYPSRASRDLRAVAARRGLPPSFADGLPTSYVYSGTVYRWDDQKDTLVTEGAER